MKLISVVAASQNNVIGVNNQMPWHLPDDFKHFKQLTIGHTIVMGRNTWISIGEKPLPQRQNWIISSQLNIDEGPVKTFSSWDAVLQESENLGLEKLFIIGGGQLYKSTIDIIDAIIMTRVHVNIESGDAFFPAIDMHQFTLTANIYHPKDERHAYDFSFETWERNK